MGQCLVCLSRSIEQGASETELKANAYSSSEDMKDTNYKNRNRSLVSAAAVLASLVGLASAQAATVAYWNFEEGSAGANVDRGGLGDGVFFPAVQDQSGNGYHLSTWSDGGGAGYVYSPSVAGSTLPLNGAPNNLSVRNTGGFPAMWTETGTALQTWSPSAWTIEVAFQPELSDSHRTLVGRDSRGANTAGASPNGDLSALYLQIQPDESLAIKYNDANGYWHEAISTPGLVQGFSAGSDPDGITGQWQGAAAVSDGSTLSLYYRNIELEGGWELVAQTDLTLSGSIDTALTPGTGDGGDWDAGNFSVGRGLYAGGHGDRAWGWIDEVRLSDSALTPTEFLMVPEPSTFALAALGLGVGFAAFMRRKRD
jgi:hypothetical protein